jgi:hypothetical protein
MASPVMQIVAEVAHLRGNVRVAALSKAPLGEGKLVSDIVMCTFT